MPEIENPLVTFALVAYNQERYIREAVRGALSQTYFPLQIILSDDCSADRTFEIIQEIAAEYKGPHKVTTIQQSKNRGFTAHINQLMTLVQGDLFVIAAGDDISLPGRTEEVVQAWKKEERCSGSIYSDFFEIDVDGKATGNEFTGPVEHDFPTMIRNTATSGMGVFGATHAWTPDIFSIFGDLDPRAIDEDKIIPFRSALIGKITHINKKLINYRKLPESQSKTRMRESYADWAEMATRNWRNRLAVFESNLTDLELAYSNHLIQTNQFAEVHKLLIMEIARCEARLKFLQGGFLAKIQTILHSGTLFGFRQRAKWMALCLAPWVMGRRFQSFVGRLPTGGKRQVSE